MKRDTSGSNISDRKIGPDLVTRGETNELKDVLAKLKKKTAAEVVQMCLVHTLGEPVEPGLTADTESKTSIKGMNENRNQWS